MASAESRARASATAKEAAYREEFVTAVRGWLDFTDEFDELAQEFAQGAAERAAVVSSGRVGRIKKLPLEERAALAARAYIRHRFTDYEDLLVELDPVEAGLDDFEYRDVKSRAHEAVDAFLVAHRRP